MNDNLKNTVGNTIGNSKDTPIRLTTTGNFQNIGVKHNWRTSFGNIHEDTQHYEHLVE
jgi:hypothetical protein